MLTLLSQPTWEPACGSCTPVAPALGSGMVLPPTAALDLCKPLAGSEEGRRRGLENSEQLEGHRPRASPHHAHPQARASNWSVLEEMTGTNYPGFVNWRPVSFSAILFMRIESETGKQCWDSCPLPNKMGGIKLEVKAIIQASSRFEKEHLKSTNSVSILSGEVKFIAFV